MKITIAKEEFIRGLQSVQNVVNPRTTLPVLSNVLLEAEDGKLTLTATDLDVTVSCTVKADIASGGRVTLPAKKLFGIVRELSTPEIELEVNDKNVCSLHAGASFFKIVGLAANEFPPIPGFQEAHRITLSQESLRSMIKRTAYAVSSEESRYVLNGIFFSIKEFKLTLVATDGRRLALIEEELEEKPEVQEQFIVPTKAINELNRLLGDGGTVLMQFQDNQASFLLEGEDGGSTLLISKLIEGSYPNYAQVIPKQCKERVSLVREELLHALRRAEIMTSDKAHSVKFAFSENNLQITANTPEVGEARENIAINYAGNDITVSFNPVYMMDPLKVLEDDEVFLELSDELSPGVLKVQSPFIYVIMPMRTNPSA
ncbi:MAG: DNA polymerase III subunit beta [Limisphaerales bacterium]|jgi:DNA polymerase-3 subunit beta|nr:DNA polymerase III subunit beta [Verrucomicrobiota bacterium]